MRMLRFLAAIFFLNTFAYGADVAILDSANTKHFFALHYAACSPPTSFTLGADEYQRYFRGWEFVLQTNGISYNIISDDDVIHGALENYKLLILSNTASLSDAEDKIIDHWVRSGHSLLATFGSGYKDVVSDPHQLDGLKLQNGGTAGLHQLWHDPLSKLFTTLLFTPGVDVQITQYSGPTAGLRGMLPNNTLPYGAAANLLIQRPPTFGDAYGFLNLGTANYTKPAPAILVTKDAHGGVIYFAFAPEYIVSKEFDLPAALPCPDGQNWAGRSTELRILMRDSVLYL